MSPSGFAEIEQDEAVERLMDEYEELWIASRKLKRIFSDDRCDDEIEKIIRKELFKAFTKKYYRFDPLLENAFVYEITVYAGKKEILGISVLRYADDDYDGEEDDYASEQHLFPQGEVKEKFEKDLKELKKALYGNKSDGGSNAESKVSGKRKTE